MTALVVGEHEDGALRDAVLNTVTAAGQLGGEVHVLVAGSAAAAEAAAKIAGVAKVLSAEDAIYEHPLAESLATLIVGLAGDYDAVLAAGNTFGKNVIPRPDASAAPRP